MGDGDIFAAFTEVSAVGFSAWLGHAPSVSVQFSILTSRQRDGAQVATRSNCQKLLVELEFLRQLELFGGEFFDVDVLEGQNSN